jgi:drug/metabolite transporter (DMT)-like permease
VPEPRTTTHRHPLAGAALTTLAALGFSIVPATTKTLFDAGTNALGIMTVRFSLAALILLTVRVAWARAEGWPRPGDAVVMVLCGAVGVTVVSLLYFIAIADVDTSLAIVIWYGYPVTVVLFTWIVWRLAPTRVASVAIVGAIAGVALSAGEIRSGGTRTALVLIVVSAVVFGAYIIALQRAVSRMGYLTGVALLNAGSALGYLTVCAVPFDRLGGAEVLEPVLPDSPRAYALIAALAVFGTVVPFLSSMAGLRLLDPTSYSILMTIEPVIAIGIGVAFLGESMTGTRLAGAVLVIGSLVAYTAAESRRTGAAPMTQP